MALRSGITLKEGRYQIQQLLGQGGFGFVYLAYDWLAECQVVLKELHPLLVSDGPVLRRFLREGRAIQRLQHPNIVRAEGMLIVVTDRNGDKDTWIPSQSRRAGMFALQAHALSIQQT